MPPFQLAASSQTPAVPKSTQFEVAEIMGKIKEPIVPDGVECINYAFDATPFELITKIITQDGVFSPEELIKRYK